MFPCHCLQLHFQQKFDLLDNEGYGDKVMKRHMGVLSATSFSKWDVGVEEIFYFFYIKPIFRHVKNKFKNVLMPDKIKKYQNVIYIVKLCHQFILQDASM